MIRRLVVLPLSFAQRRLWFLERVEGTGATYNLPLALRLRGPLRVDALRLALGDVVQRHEPLRTVFRERDGEPYQDVLDSDAGHPGMPLVPCDADRLDEELMAAAAVPVAVGNSELPLRATLFKTGPGDHVLLLVVHHAAMDGQSVDTLLRDVSTAYRARVGRSSAPSWDGLPVQYADYTLWQRELLGDAQDPRSLHAVQAAFWKRTLAGLPTPLPLPVDRPRPAVASHRGAAVPFNCDAKLHHALTELAREHRCTPFMVVHAALCVLLTRLGSGPDIAIGSAVSGRVDEALNDLVGFFVNTVVLRVDLSGDPGFAEVLRRVRKADLDAYAHQDLPFDLVVETVNPVRSLAHNPLFQVMMSFESDPAQEPDFGEVRAAVRPLAPLPTAKTDLTFQLVERQRGGAQGIEGHLEYATDLFDASTAESIVSRLLTVLDAVTTDPSLRVSEIGLLTEAERRLVMEDWNATRRELPVTTLPEALSDQALRTPDAPAVIDGRRTLTYAELHTRADRLARYLNDIGAGPRTVVALALPRSADFVVSVLAVVKAGCAYLPLDPEHPVERLAHMLRDAQSPCVLTDRTTCAALPDDGPAAVFVDEPLPPVARGRTTRPPAPHDPAYVIYTSGSTGLPKGVVVSHSAIDNRLRWMQDTFPLTSGDRVLHKTPCGFDVSVWELFWPLREGAAMVVARPGDHRDPARLARTVREHGVTVTHFVPSLLNHFLAEPAAAACTGLRRVFCSGEALSRDTADAFHRLLPGVALENLYGPTEAAVDVTWHRCRPGERGPVPIGKPVHNTRAHVLDETLRPCPPGLPGELYLAGAQLALGYLGRSALTASRFVADPFGPPGSRMYRTGDIVRWRADGSIEYLGREDTQVKLHGQRLELGEIESVLGARAEVGSVCAVLRSDGGEQRLVAYVTPACGPSGSETAGAVPQPGRLREHLAGRLPAYMLPSDIVVVDRFPLTTNGKLDRAALPPPPSPGTAGGRAPRTPQERAVVEVFAELLGLTGIGVDDDFFRAGGTSLLAIRLVRRLRQVLGAEISVQTVFRRPTAAALARHLAEGHAEPDGLAPLLPLRPQGSGLPLFFVHPGTGLSWCYFRLLEHLDCERPVYGLQARGLRADDDASELPVSVAEMADDYVRRIRQAQPTGPYHLLGWSFGGQVAHAMAARLRAAGEAVGLLVVFDSYPGTGDVGEPAGQEEVPADALHGFFDGAHGAGITPGVVDDVLVGRLRRSFAPLSDADPRDVRSTVGVAVNNVRLMSRFVPDLFDGDLVLVTAADGSPHDSRPDRGWGPHVGGRVTVLHVDCGHYEMFGTAVADVGRLLSQVLRAPASTQA
ncbi:hypothetical protein ADK58_28365 [Streptomyces sp. XY152]|nr:hypothetical protein ADK58_28365 [Streptomyces sp. XY152]